jgi:hypothetical protein
VKSWGASKLASITLMSALLFAAGCGPTHVQREVVAAGTPSHLEGPALVLLPRTCIVDHRVSRHASPRGPGSRTTLQLRQVLDAMVPYASSASSESALPVESCKPPPDLSADPARLSQLRASEHTLGLMRERGVQHVVVIEIRATIACISDAGATFLVHHDVAGFAPSNAVAGATELCDEDQIDLSAFVFGEDGAAVWAGTREIEPGEPVEPAVQRLLQRVPVMMPLTAVKPGTKDVRCRLDDRGGADCT